MHTFGGQVGQKIRAAREQVAALIGALPEEIIFTSCGTESDNSAIRSALTTQPDKKHIVTSRVEHPAVRALCAQLAAQGYRVTELSVDKNGVLDLENLEKTMTPDTAVVSLMWGNNETCSKTVRNMLNEWAKLKPKQREEVRLLFKGLA